MVSLKRINCVIIVLQLDESFAGIDATDSSKCGKPYHRINTQPEVRLRVGAFDVGVLVFSAAAIFLASVHGKCLRFTEDV